MNENEIYRISCELAIEDIGVYPEFIVNKYGKNKKRTKRQDGWNDCVSKIEDDIAIFELFLSGLNNEILTYIMNDKIKAVLEEKEINLFVSCNDLFYWGCSDAEDFEEKDLNEFNKSIEDSSKHGKLLWCCRKRNMRPQKPYYRYFNDKEVGLFNQCGEERDV